MKMIKSTSKAFGEGHVLGAFFWGSLAEWSIWDQSEPLGTLIIVTNYDPSPLNDLDLL